VVDASVREICTKGDNLLTEETSKVSFKWINSESNNCLDKENCICKNNYLTSCNYISFKASPMIKTLQT